jgi:glycosyltransferase involved in cell wall biosynthesis/peptidoglycan/xylan/chitin deacetylase (PgdA/CDA1 family)
MIELSVVIPTYNRAGRLQACLQALTRQTQPASDFEVIVVVDGSTDETLDIVRKFDAPFLIRSVWQENSGQPAALNQGIVEAKGRYCLFLDDDIVASPQLVAEHLLAQREHENVVAIGQITLSLLSTAGWYARAFAQGWHDHYNMLNQGNAKLTWEDCYSGNLSAPRDSLLACGGFTTDMIRGYDVELAYRLEKEGCSFMYLPQAVGFQDERKGFRELSQDAENAGMMDVTLYKRDLHMLTQALASFPVGSWRKLLLRRMLLALHVPPKLLELWGRFIKDTDQKYSWYSFIQNHFYWRGVRRASKDSNIWAQLTSGIPILMYHAVGLPNEPAGPFVMPAFHLLSHIAWIKRFGYQVISLDQFLSCQHERRFPPMRSVIITFDDGYLDNFTRAYPILHRHNIAATIFLVSDYVGHTNKWDNAGQLAGRPLMGWSQIKELATQGIKFGAHTCTHPLLPAISPTQAFAEIINSREHLERELGKPVNVFAYPYGEHDQSIQAMVEQAGFTAGCTINAGLNSLITPAMGLYRTEIKGTDSVVRLWLALWLGDADAIWRRRYQC